MKWFVNHRPVEDEVKDYNEHGIIFLVEDGEIVAIGREKDDADRE